jgi:hypothetical protein
VRLLAWAAVAVAVVMRVNNALRYRTRMGFDAIENVEYVQHLLSSWSLPAPDAAWATSHPPLFYYAAAALGRMLAAFDAAPALVWVVPLCSSAAGFATAWAVYQLVRRTAPEAPARAWLGVGLVLYTPVHVYMSAMFGEEILASTFASLAIVGAALTMSKDDAGGARAMSKEKEGRNDAGADVAAGRPGSDARGALVRAAGLGVLAGLAWLTKLSGVLVVGAIGLAWVVRAWRKREGVRALGPIAVFGLSAMLVGGWFYARNWLSYGYLYPQGLAVHAIMFEMPPGDRGVLDYLYVPLATWTDPQLLNPDLLHSVWGSTWATLWFDGHRHFLPHSVSASYAGTALGLLAIVPMAAFAHGVVRGARRWRSDPAAADGPLLALLALTCVGYVVFTARNPWFATIKGSYMLCAVAPFAFYASEGLWRWMRGGGWPARIVGASLAALALGVALVFSIGAIFTKLDATGLPWRAAA